VMVGVWGSRKNSQSFPQVGGERHIDHDDDSKNFFAIKARATPRRFRFFAAFTWSGSTEAQKPARFWEALRSNG